jgi:hypothetical protein
MKQIKLKEDEQIQITAPNGFHLTVNGVKIERDSTLFITQKRDAEKPFSHPYTAKMFEENDL